MSRRASTALLVLSLLLLLGVTGAFGASRRAADNGTLLVGFQLNKSIVVTLGDGTPVGTQSGTPTTIPPGTYNIIMSNPTFQNDIQWDLSGPGVSLVSNMSYGEEPSEAWVETFLPSSTYTWRDDLRPPTVWTFVTSASGSPVSSGPTTPVGVSTTPISTGTGGKAHSTDVVGSDQLLGTLVGTVSATGKATLTSKGKPVTSLRQGRYTFTITDSSKHAGFIVQANKKAAQTITSPAFTGKKSVTVDLEAGQWLYYPSVVGAKSYFIVAASSS